MTEAHQCDACGQPAPDTAICPNCVNTLRNALDSLPELWAQLEIRLSGVKGVDYRGKGGSRSSERPLPIDRAAYEFRTDIRNTLTTWARVLIEEQGHTA